MFWTFFQYLSIKRLGLAKPILLIFLTVLFGCLIAGLIYAAVVLQAVNKQHEVHHVQHHASH